MAVNTFLKGSEEIVGGGCGRRCLGLGRICALWKFRYLYAKKRLGPL